MRWLVSACAVLSSCLVAACTDAENTYDPASAAGSMMELTPQSEPWLVSDTLYLQPGLTMRTMAAPASK
jgi:hypothetical protein